MAIAAGPETQHQAASLQATGYTPVRTELAPPNMGSPGAGQLWAQVGRTAMEAGTMLMNSPLNPAVREELKARYKSAEEGINQFNRLDQAGIGPVMYQIQPGGAATAIAPGQIQDKTMATQVLGRLGIGPKIGTGGEEQKLPPEPGTGTGGDEEKKTEEEKKAQPPTAEEAGGAKKQPPTAEEAGGGQASTATSGSSLYAAYGTKPPPEAPSQPYYSASTETGAIPATSTTQGVERQPAAEYRAQYEQAQQREAKAQADIQALKLWQAQNAHPVASSSDAVTWGKGFDTRITDATYLPSGGPNGEPAYAFHLKGGAVNTVPISQMVKNGFGPSVAGQNTSTVLSASEAPPQAPGMALGATGQPPAGMNLGQPAPGQVPPGQAPPGQVPPGQAPPGGPPPAPAPPQQAPITDIYGNPLSAYTSVASKGGQTPDQLTAQTTPAGQAAEPPLGSRITPVPPPLPNNNLISQDEQRSIQTAANAMPPLDPNKPYAGDREVVFPGSPYHWRIDDNPLSGSYKGRIYTAEPPEPGHLFNPRRWYLGDEGYRSVELPASGMRDEVKKYWVDQRGDLSPEEVMVMPEDELKIWLKRKWEFQNLRMLDPDKGTANTLDGGAEYVKAIAQVKDNLNALKALGENPDSIGKLLTTLGGAVQSFRIPIGDPYVTQAYQNLEQSVRHADDVANAYKELLLQEGKGGGVKGGIPLWLFRGAVGGELKGEVPESSRLESVFSGRSLGSKLMDIDSIYKDATQKYGNMVQDSHGQWLRISPKHDVNVNRLDAKKQIDDPYNLYLGARVPIAQDDLKDFGQKHPDTNVHIRMNDGTYINGWTPKSIGQKMGKAQ